ARGESLAAFDGRCILAGGVAPPFNTPGIAPHRAQDARWGPRCAVVAPRRRGPHGADCAPWGGTARRLARLGATPHFHHGLLAADSGRKERARVSQFSSVRAGRSNQGRLSP